MSDSDSEVTVSLQLTLPAIHLLTQVHGAARYLYFTELLYYIHMLYFFFLYYLFCCFSVRPFCSILELLHHPGSVIYFKIIDGF